MVAYSGSAPDVVAEKPAVMVASAEPSAGVGGLPGVAQADLPDTVAVASVTSERPAKAPAAKAVAVAAAWDRAGAVAAFD